MKVLVTGVAGFIGFHTARRLLEAGIEVVGIDNLNGYYSVELKRARLALLVDAPGFEFHLMDIVDKTALSALFNAQRFTHVLHLAAQAGVRYSLQAPDVYGQTNLVGFLNVLEACRQYPPEHLVYASSSSVYGANSKIPFCVEDPADQPLSLYAASKRANELMALSYGHICGLRATGLRFFTVYGPWGRPDMALFKFTEAMLQGVPIDVYNHGEMARDFTYIDDIVESIIRLLPMPPQAENHGEARTRILNIGRGNPVQLMDFVRCVEQALGCTALKNFAPMQPGDAPTTWADTSAITGLTGFQPRVDVQHGVAEFVKWYRAFYCV